MIPNGIPQKAARKVAVPEMMIARIAISIIWISKLMINITPR